MAQTPAVLLITFNRPDTTIRVLERIRDARPRKLYVASDGPRQGRVGEAEKVARTRELVSTVDWPCEVKTLFREHNVGCGRGVSGAIDWFLKAEQEGIILEDDCVADPTFFPFVAELLERYRDDEKVGMIAGSNYQFGRNATPESYYWSRYMHCWGWATWRRSWADFDFEMKDWPAFRDARKLDEVFEGDERAVRYWSKRFDIMLDPVQQKEHRVDAWDYQFFFSTLKRGCLNVIPNVNLISNIGFIPESTHTGRRNELAEMPIHPMKFPLVHPVGKVRNARADDFTERQQFGKRSLFKKVYDRVVYR